MHDRFYPLVVPALVVILTAAPLKAQVVTCDLERADGVVFGECYGFLRTPIRVSLEAAEQPGLWAGTMELGRNDAAIDVVEYEYSEGPRRILRTPMGWFLPTTLRLQGDSPELEWSLSAEAPPSDLDVAVLDRARELLDDESVWDRADDRVCAPSDELFSLYCAMAEGVRQVTGEYQHRQPALQVVRRIVASRFGDRVINHRLMDFNNDPATTFDEVLDVLATTRIELVETKH